MGQAKRRGSHEQRKAEAAHRLQDEVDANRCQIDMPHFADMANLIMQAASRAVTAGDPSLIDTAIKAYRLENGNLLLRTTGTIAEEVEVPADKWRLISEEDFAADEQRLAGELDSGEHDALVEELNEKLQENADHLSAAAEKRQLRQTHATHSGLIFDRSDMGLQTADLLRTKFPHWKDQLDAWEEAKAQFFLQIMPHAEGEEAMVCHVPDLAALTDDALPQIFGELLPPPALPVFTVVTAEPERTLILQAIERLTPPVPGLGN